MQVCTHLATSLCDQQYLATGIYTIILFKYVAVSKLQVAILARSSREMSQTVLSTESTSSQEFASQFGLAIFLNTGEKRYREDRVSVECAGHGRSIANDNISDNSDHSVERLIQNGDNENLNLHGLKNVVFGIHS